MTIHYSLLGPVTSHIVVYTNKPGGSQINPIYLVIHMSASMNSTTIKLMLLNIPDWYLKYMGLICEPLDVYMGLLVCGNYKNNILNTYTGIAQWTLLGLFGRPLVHTAGRLGMLCSTRNQINCPEINEGIQLYKYIVHILTKVINYNNTLSIV